MRKYILYKHTSPSGKVYIGQTSRKPELRWGSNGVFYKGSTAFWNAIQKYGWNNIEHKIIAWDLTQEEANLFEKAFIKMYKDKNMSYNIAFGGTDGIVGIKRTDETKKKQSIAHKKLWEDKEYREKLRNKFVGRKSSMYGKKMLQESREKMSNKKSIPIAQYTLDGEFIRTWKSAREVQITLGFAENAISACCLGRTKKSHNYIWKRIKNTDSL